MLAALVVAGLLVAVAPAAMPAGADELSDKRAEAARVADELEALDARLMDLASQYERNQYELDQLGAELAEAQAAADAAQAQLQQRRGELQGYAVNAYMGGDDDAWLSALFSQNGDEAVPRKAYLEASAGDRRDLMDSLASAQQQAEEEGAALTALQEEAQAKADSLADARDGAEEAAEAKRALSARVQGELAQLVRAEADRRAAEQRAAAEAAAQAARAAAPATTAPRGGATAPAQSTSRPAPAEESGGGGGGGSSTQLRSGLAGAIDAALSKVGSPYGWGIAGPNSFDCSGLIYWSLQQVGISIGGRSSGAMYNVTSRISRGDLQPGDLVFWGSGGSEHVAFYMGGNQLVHSFGSGGGVAVTHLDGWWKAPTGYGRIR